MPHVPLTHCPDCGYNLHGLPARHRCPECGFEYDEHTRIWKPTRPWLVYFGILLADAGVIILFDPHKVIHGLLAAQIDRSNIVMAIVIGFQLVFAGWMLVRAFDANRLGRYVAVTPSGIKGRLVERTFQVPWAQIRGARVVRREGKRRTFRLERESRDRVELVYNDANRPIEKCIQLVDGYYGAGVLHARKNGEEFRAAVEAARARYCSSLPPTQPAGGVNADPKLGP